MTQCRTIGSLPLILTWEEPRAWLPLRCAPHTSRSAPHLAHVHAHAWDAWHVSVAVTASA